jgi:hypothetical protein
MCTISVHHQQAHVLRRTCNGAWRVWDGVAAALAFIQMALRRLGITYEMIDYLLSIEFDRRNEQRVRTYYGDSEAFECERGTCPQGGI